MGPPNKEDRLDSSKQPKLFSSEINIPISVFSDRSVATLEAVVEYMKDVLKLSYHEIAVHLHRDDRTIWTCYDRVQKKRSKRG